MRAFAKQETSIDRALSLGDFQNLDEEVEEYVAAKARDVDGRPKLLMLEMDFQDLLDLPGTGTDEATRRKLEAWKNEFPASAYRPIVEATILNMAAWRARGHGYSSEVAQEGWKLFHERNLAAWQMLMDNRENSSRIPTWYSRAIMTGIDSGASDSELRELFEEALARHPDYYPIHFAYMRRFAPNWGGSFKAIDRFIREQVDAKTNIEGEQLYARLYWAFDEYYRNRDSSLFENSAMNWPRMRKGFEEIMKTYPESQWNRASFASFACRAHDATSYLLLRPKVQEVSFWNAAPEGLSLEVCDARFMKET